MYKDIEDLIQHSKKSAEIKRGLAVKQDLAQKNRSMITEILGVCPSYVSKWRLIYETYGVNGLVSCHRGAAPRAFLTEAQRASVIKHIEAQEIFSPKDLALYLKDTYGISFKSSQSYYNLLQDAKMSYYKSQKINPRRDEEKIEERRKEIKKNLKSIEKR